MVVNLSKWKQRNRARKQTLTKKVAKLAKMVRLAKPEVKWSITQATSTAFTGTSGLIFSPLTSIAQATTDYNGRIGDEITLKSMRVGMQFANNNATNSIIGRVVVFCHKSNPDGVVGIASQINLFLHSASIVAGVAPYAPYDHDNASSYKVLKDFTFTVDPIAGAGSSASMANVFKKIYFRVPVKGMKIGYSVAGTTVTKNEIFVLVLTDSGGSQNVAYLTDTTYIDP